MASLPMASLLRIVFFRILPIAVITLFVLEFSLRAYKSLTYDGVLHLSTSSINENLDRKYGWMSPKSLRYHKSDSCYGTGEISYNEEGFRAPPVAQIATADPLVCILGDSLLQGYQIPDGMHLPHLLHQELKEEYPQAYVLPLGVGGYSSVQQLMLYNEFCKDRNPDLTIVLYSENDVIDNSYKATLRLYGNNARPTPYLSNGEIVIKRPYPISISFSIDNLLVMRVVNALTMKVRYYFNRPWDSEWDTWREEGYEIMDYVAEQLARTKEPKVFLTPYPHWKEGKIFKSHGFELVQYKNFYKSMRCLPRDPHPNTTGHQVMNEALVPAVKEILKRIRSQE